MRDGRRQRTSDERTSDERTHTNWDRARLSVVVPIGVIVAVAIVCIVIAVLSSAERADDVAIAHEQRLFSEMLSTQGRRVLREVQSVANSPATIRNVRKRFDFHWVDQQVGLWLQTFFNHDYVFVFDANGQPIYARATNHGISPAWMHKVVPNLKSMLAYMGGHRSWPGGAIAISNAIDGPRRQAAVIRDIDGHPAVIAAATVGAPPHAPVLMSVKLIAGSLLSSIAEQLQLTDLRSLGNAPVPAGDHVFDLDDPQGHRLARFAWTPKQPGAEIMHSVIPFIAVALAGFALLAAFVLRYMRRTAAEIAVGETRLRHLAMHDPLCGLPNRIFFGERLRAVIEQVRHGSTPAAVFYIDLDHFKDVNDTLGHPIGDELIRLVTQRLSHALRGDDLVARLGGDEFAVISSIGDDPAKMMALAQRVINTLSAPYAIHEHNIVIGASVGIAAIDRNCAGVADVMRYADMALYRAKNEGRNRACMYDAVMDADLSSRKLLEADLREAIENDRLTLHYQPVVAKDGETVVAVEALCRWTHPGRGEIPPSEFIPVAERSGLIIELGNWVLRRACIDGRAWPELTIAVNVSSLQFRRLDFVDVVERILEETAFDPTRLELELTESVLLGNVDTAEIAMRRLKAFGVKVALDDFGTGYSSLLYLRRFPFDKLKIDRSFVHSIEKAADAAAIVHAVVGLGRGLGMQVTAEGVETADQQLFLRAAGVHSMQGYRFGRPVPAEEITRRLEASGAAKPADAALAS
ncbi:MAG: EAL domain-containing protein [Pseudolabrys sp.]